MSVYCRDRVNPQMFIYALSVAILHRPDTKDVPIPPLSEIFPDKYIDSAVFARAREEANVVPAGSRVGFVLVRRTRLISPTSLELLDYASLISRPALFRGRVRNTVCASCESHAESRRNSRKLIPALLSFNSRIMITENFQARAHRPAFRPQLDRYFPKFTYFAERVIGFIIFATMRDARAARALLTGKLPGTEAGGGGITNCCNVGGKFCEFSKKRFIPAANAKHRHRR